LNTSISVNILKLLSGRVVIQVLIILTTPVITRLYSPKHFGVIQIFDSIASILFVMTCLKYDRSIPLGKNRQEASASFVLSVSLTCIFTICTLVGVQLSKAYIAHWFNAPELEGFLWLLPASFVMYGLGISLISWASREGRFGTIALSDFGKILSEKTTAIALGYLIRASATGLFVSRLIGEFVNVSMLFGFLRQKLFSDIKNAHLTLDTLKIVGTQHKKFPLFRTWAELLNLTAIQLPSLIFGAYFSPTIVGYYSLGYRVITLPATFLGRSIAQVFFPTAAKEYQKTGTLSPIVKPIFTRLVQIGVFPMVSLGLFGATLFSAVFGQRWAEAGVYAQFLAVWHFLAFLDLPLDIFALVNRQEISLWITILSLSGRAASLFLGVTFGSPRLALGLFVLFSTGLLTGKLIWKLRLSQVSTIWAFNLALKYIALSFALLLPVKCLSYVANDFRVDFVALCFAAVGYAAVLLMVEPSLRQFVVTILIRFKNQSVFRNFKK
jgi:lipopolysaccharide exporter